MPQKRFDPTPAQVRVMDRLEAGDYLYRAEWVNGSGWVFIHPVTGGTSRVHQSVAAAILHASWIAKAGEPEQVNASTRRLRFALTPLGLAALRRHRERDGV